MEDQIVTLETYQDPALAHIIRARLEANDIPCFLADENMIGINPLYNQALGGIKLKIFARDMAICQAILAEDFPQEEPEQPLADDDTVCPHCHSSNVRFGPATQNKFNLWTVFVSFLLLIYPFHSRKAWHCFNCGKDFND